MSNLADRVILSTTVVNDFPKPGIPFRDITPLLLRPEVFSDVVDWMAEQATQMEATSIGGIESRGFLFASAVAYKLKLPFVLFRKPNKLPRATLTCDYEKEYGKDALSVQATDIYPKDKVVIIDDVLATGGTAGAAGKITTTIAGARAGFIFLFEIGALPGKALLAQKYDVAVLAKV